MFVLEKICNFVYDGFVALIPFRLPLHAPIAEDLLEGYLYLEECNNLMIYLFFYFHKKKPSECLGCELSV